MIARYLVLAAVAALCAAVLGACGDAVEPPSFLRVAGGEPAKGRDLIYAYGCGACHTIEGIRGARGTVGPPLVDYAERALLAGILPNTPRHLVPWLMDPVALDPQTGMPAIGLTEPEARHIAAYLYTLGAERTQVYPGGPPLELRGREEPVLRSGGQPGGGPDSADTTPRARFLERGAGRRE
jgi:mono/diheme cytochrome c family protein